MTKAQLLAELEKLTIPPQDPEEAHAKAEDLLLQYINDPRVKAAFDAIEKWYA